MKLLSVVTFALLAGCAAPQPVSPSDSPAISPALASENRSSDERNRQIESLKQKQAARASKGDDQKQAKLDQKAAKKAEADKIAKRHFDEFTGDPSEYMREHAAVISAFKTMATKCEISYQVYGRLDASRKRECIRMFEMIDEPEQISAVTLIVSAAPVLRDANAMSFDQRTIVREAEKGLNALKTIRLY